MQTQLAHSDGKLLPGILLQEAASGKEVFKSGVPTAVDQKVVPPPSTHTKDVLVNPLLYPTIRIKIVH